MTAQHQGPPSRFGRLLQPVARMLFKLALGANTLTTEQMRRRLDWVGAMSKELSGVQRVPLRVGDLDALWLIPDSADQDSPVILYLHGGAFISGSLRSHWELAGRLARAARARCLMIDYRLAPEHPYPAALNDAVASWDWLLNEGYYSANMVIAGDSAGGGLAVATSLKLRELGWPQPAGLYCMSPFTDLSLSSDSHHSARAREVVLTNPNLLVRAVADYAPGHDLKDPLVSPVYADFHAMPPLLVHVGTDEVLLNDATRLHDQAVACGAPCTLEVWPGMWHVWPVFERVGLPEARKALLGAGEFIRRVCATRAPQPFDGARDAVRS